MPGVAVAQAVSTRGAVAANLEHHCQLAERATEEGAEIVFSPEAYPVDTGLLSDAASRHAMAVVMANAGGPATRPATAGGSAVWSDSAGKPLALGRVDQPAAPLSREVAETSRPASTSFRLRNSRAAIRG